MASIADVLCAAGVTVANELCVVAVVAALSGAAG